MRACVIDIGSRKQMQRGVALITALIFLVILTLLGLSVVGSTNSEEKMGRNVRDQDIAFSAAEAALRDAEMHISGSWIWPYSPVDLLSFNSSCTNGLCDSTILPATPIDQIDFYSGSTPGSNSVVLGDITSSPTIVGLPTANQPRYMIEMTCTILGSGAASPCNKAFRITAQGRGRLPDTRVVLQEVYLPADFVN